MLRVDYEKWTTYTCNIQYELIFRIMDYVGNLLLKMHKLFSNQNNPS